ncbi:EamA family transporter, partial [Pseudomonas syringae]|uniref:EamA family transporter n=1 Tax=Pseudomonas syringae TaxID=317 RepID=UPI0034D393FF
QVISWALLLALPFMLLLTIANFPAPDAFAKVSAPAWFRFGFVSLFSMLIGFVFWYRGLVQGGIAAVGQLQLVQPVMGLGLAALLLHEHVSWM